MAKRNDGNPPKPVRIWIDRTLRASHVTVLLLHWLWDNFLS